MAEFKVMIDLCEKMRNPFLECAAEVSHDFLYGNLSGSTVLPQEQNCSKQPNIEGGKTMPHNPTLPELYAKWDKNQKYFAKLALQISAPEPRLHGVSAAPSRRNSRSVTEK